MLRNFRAQEGTTKTWDLSVLNAEHSFSNYNIRQFQTSGRLELFTTCRMFKSGKELQFPILFCAVSGK